MANTSTIWNTATLKKLKNYAEKGISTSEIGAKLGISKNAVVGKLNRMGWNKTANPKIVKPAQKKAPVKKESVLKVAPKTVKKTAVRVKAEPKAKPVKIPKITTDKVLASHQRIIQHSLEMANLKHDQCRYPIGDPDGNSFHFCGKKVFMEKPYCYEHCKCAYQFTPVKKK